ncbi:MAG: methylated-DNA--[protein]-cysteine S-methyltransferase [Kiloniellales bacterium]|nr:methylated-DNA--[protein]-cysteine S-methyltransferase [Myxococcota bacterium]MDJ0936220.1 methylated-DNA--[protein]-cysteine S-methyltransferase [Kiloniellales bacterium]
MHASTIHFTTVRCALGWLLVARTARGLCSLRFGEAPGPLAEALRDDFPFADLREDAGRLASCVAALERYLDGRAPRLDLPLDVRGSQFQRRVWDAIRAIPYGQTQSYGALARTLGRPRAARAVAGACAANPVALAIPCHRVVPAAGRTGGYRWGAERKAALLNLERDQQRGGEAGIIKESDHSLSCATVLAWPAPPRRARARRSRPAAAQPDSGSSMPPSTA